MLERWIDPAVQKQTAALAELLAPVRDQLAALQREIQADREAFAAAKARFEVEMDALRAELQAERATFQNAAVQLKEMFEASRQLGTADMARLVNTVDAALVTLVLNSAPASKPENLA